MTLLQSLLHLTNFKSSLLQTLVPSVSAVFAIQTTFAIPSIAAQSDRFFDFSGALTFVAVTTLSLYLPSLRTRYAAETLLSKPSPLPSLLALFRSDSSRGVPLNWRQVALTGAVSLWATRCEFLPYLSLQVGVAKLVKIPVGTYLFHRILQEGGDSRFDKIKIKPTRYAIAYTVQSVWICLCSMPVIAVNAIPSAAFPSRLRVMDVLGLSLYLGGFTLEVLADWQKAKWVRQRKEKVHDEQFLTRGLWSKRFVLDLAPWLSMKLTEDRQSAPELFW